MSATIYEKMFKKLLTGLEHPMQGQQRKLAHALSMISQSLKELRAHVLKHPFANQQEEILFFKEIKPRFYSLWIYEFESHTLEINRPAGTPEMLRVYYEEELQLIQRYFRQHAFYYQYYRSGATELDHLCFVRGNVGVAVAVPDMPETAHDFCSPCDHLFARFMAYEKIQDDILKGLHPESVNPKEKGKEKKAVQRTQVALSVDQLGLIARAADDARLLLGRSFSKICEDIAPYLSTPERDMISAGSMRSNAYTGEDTDKHNVIRMLEKMIGFIKGY